MTSTNFCSVCERLKNSILSVVHCDKCNEQYCKECADRHEVMNATKNHITTSIITDAGNIYNVNNVCLGHRFNLDYFCKDHDEIVCVECVRRNHQQCGSLCNLDVATGKFYLLVLHSFENALDAMSEATKVLEVECFNNEQSLEINYQKQKKIILEELKEIEKVSLQNLETKLIEAKSKIKKNRQLLQQKNQEVVKLKENINIIKSQHRCSSTFRVIEGLRRQFESSIHKIILETNFTYNLEFILNSNFVSMMETEYSLGESKIDNTPSENVIKILSQIKQIKVSDITLTHRETVNIKTESTVPSEIENCKVLDERGILIMDSGTNPRVYIDTRIPNESPKEFDISKGNSHPCDIEIIGDDRFVVSYFGVKVLSFFSIENGNHINDKTMPDCCYGLSFYNGELFVMCEDKYIHVLSTKSFAIVRKIPLGLGDHNVYRFVVTKRNIICRLASEKSVYCSNSKNDRIWTFTDPSSESIKGLAVDKRNFVYVADASKGLYVIEPSGKNSKLLLSEKDRATKPVAVYYNRNTNQLLVCLDGKKTLALYDIKID